MRKMEARIRRFGFRRVRLYPGLRVDPSDEPAVMAAAKRIALLAQRSPGIEYLLESHNGSIADSPSRLVQLVRELAVPNVGIVFQPTVFEREATLRQVEAQGPWVRHLHLQNRAVNDPAQFVRLGEGAVSWAEIVGALNAAGAKTFTASLEFVPSAICSPEAFDLDRSLAEAVAETKYAESL
jgi:sugar phosphate isomerase/epimerase